VDPVFRSRLSELVGARTGDLDHGAVTPDSVAQLALVCRLCTETATPLAVTSGPARDATPPPDGLLVSLSRLAEVRVEPGRLVARAEAGAAVSAVVDAVSAAGLAVVGVPTRPAGGRVGSLIATGRVGRRSLCGIEAVLATGERVHAGGPVLKDVAGYDLAGVLLGSGGRLALITAVTFRLVADAARIAPVEAAGAMDGAAGGELIRRAFDPAGLLRPAG
jgi:FAD/FMN-containing dehydrogenase